MNEPNFTWPPRTGTGALQAMACDQDESFAFDQTEAKRIAAEVLARARSGCDGGCHQGRYCNCGHVARTPAEHKARARAWIFILGVLLAFWAGAYTVLGVLL